MERAEELRPGSRVAARTRQRWLCEVDGMLREKFFRPSSADSREGVGADIAWDNGLRDDDVLLVPPPDLPVPAVQGGANWPRGCGGRICPPGAAAGAGKEGER